MTSLPEPRPRRPESFISGGAYGLLFVLGGLEGLIGSFQFSWAIGSFPLAAVLFAALLLVTTVLAAIGMRTAAGAVVPALGWILASLVLTLPTSAGSVIITGTSAGEWYLYGGTLCAVAGVIVALAGRVGRRR